MAEATLRLDEHADAASPSNGEAPPIGTRMGRYVVVSTLGMGSMGVVVAAWDPELDRKAALKLLRASGSRSTARARLGREAQALAKLNHANVVTVYDVGVHEGQVFVAMEFVQGTTLREWLDTPRAWRDVVRVFSAAGRGLAAAHEVGLVHRDFKPDNVMIDARERVRVMDFGLARAFDDASSDAPGDARADLDVPSLIGTGEGLGGSPLSEPLTRTGALLGTPAYMAPEQWLRVDVTPHSDQFSFCIALYEALYGQSPFAGETLDERGRAVARGELRPPPRGAKVPSHVRAVVLRGLARDPLERHASMRALLDALADDPRARWRRRGLASLIVGLSLAAAWGIWQASAREAPLEPCSGGPARLEGVWDEAGKTRVREGLAATGLSFAPDTAVRVEQRLDDYATAWVGAHRDACEAHQRGEESGELLDLRMRCLDERLQHVAATVAILSEADADVARKAVEAVAGLPSLERCADERALRAELPPPEDPELARQVAALDERRIEAEALLRSGAFERGLALASRVVDEARALDYEPLSTRAWLVAGRLENVMGHYGESEALLERAFAAAVGLGMRREAAEAAAELVWVVGYEQARHEAGRLWAKSSEPLARLVGTPEAMARHLVNVGSVSFAAGEYEEARAELERALAIREQTGPADHPDIAATLNILGNVAGEEGQYERARNYHERALAIRNETLGPDHPQVAASLNNLGILALNDREFARARAYLEQALAIRREALGPEHPQVAASLLNLGILADDEGEYSRARTHYEASLTIIEKVYGPDHPQVAITLNNLASLAKVEANYELARSTHVRALAIREKTLSPDHPHVADSLTGLGEVLLLLDEPAAALPHLERALAIRVAHEGEPLLVARTRFALARALWDAPPEAGRDRDRALELAERAARVFEGDTSIADLPAVREWLATRRS